MELELKLKGKDAEEKVDGNDSLQLVSTICVETDDRGEKWSKAVKPLKEEYNYGTYYSEEARQNRIRRSLLGPRARFRIWISYFTDEAEGYQVQLERGRGKDPAALANAEEITVMRALLGKLLCATRSGMLRGAGDTS